jgi:hypothetical protein
MNKVGLIEWFGNDSNDITACSENRIGQCSHQSNLSTPVDKGDLPFSKAGAKPLGRFYITPMIS